MLIIGELTVDQFIEKLIASPLINISWADCLNILY